MTRPPMRNDNDPVQRLLRIGKIDEFSPDGWLDYVGEFSFGTEHVPALIRLACDRRLHDLEADKAAGWAPMHAWRALAQLRATEAIAPLLALVRALPGYDAISEDLPHVFAMIGSATIAPIHAFLVSELDKADDGGGTAIESLAKVGTRHPECRDQCIAILTGELARHRQDTPLRNGLTVCALLDLKAVESIDAIRSAFAADVIDLSMAGDLEDVEIDLGLRAARATPKPRYDAFQHLGGTPAWQSRPAQPGPLAIPPRESRKIGRNDPCPCGSGKKYKKCCAA